MSKPQTLEGLVHAIHTQFGLSSGISEEVDLSGPCVFVPWGNDEESRRQAEYHAERIRKTGDYNVLGVIQSSTGQWGIAIGLEFEQADMSSLPLTLAGLGASKGVYEGTLRVISGWANLGRLLPGDVLYCPTTDTRWAEAFERAGAVVTQAGSLLCHAAIICREYKLPCVVNVRPRLDARFDGLRVRVDGKAGTMEVFAP